MPIRKISPELIAEICGEARHLLVLNLSDNQIAQAEHLERLGATLERLDLSRNLLTATSGFEVRCRLVFGQDPPSWALDWRLQLRVSTRVAPAVCVGAPWTAARIRGPTLLRHAPVHSCSATDAAPLTARLSWP